MPFAIRYDAAANAGPLKTGPVSEWLVSAWRRYVLFTFLAFAALLVACGGGGDDDDDGDGGAATAAGGVTVGSSGGTVTSTDGRVSLSVPSGALGSDTAIVIEQVPASELDDELTAVAEGGPVYRFEPSGLTFDEPATATFTFDAPRVLGPDSEAGP